MGKTEGGIDRREVVLKGLDRRRILKAAAGRRVAAAVGAALLLASLGVYSRSVLRLDPLQSYQLSYAPWPDGPELLDGALSLARDGSYAIHLAGQSHPPRYPFGPSLLTAAAIGLGADPLAAVYRLNQTAGLLLLLTVFLWPAKRGRWVEGGLAALLLACLPAFVILCRSPKSEVAGALLFVISVGLLYDYSQRGGAVRAAGGAFVLGLSVCLRLSNLLLAPFVPLAWLAKGPTRGRRSALEAAALSSSYLAGVAPLLVYNHFTFGSPLKTGYSYWLPGQGAPGEAFGFEYLKPQLANLWNEFIQNERIFTTANLYGEGSYFGPAFALLGLASLNWLARSRRRKLFLAGGAAYAFFMLIYFFADVRLFFPLMALATPAMAAASVGLAGSLARRRSWFRLSAIVLLTAAAVWGIPGKTRSTELTEMLKLRKLRHTSLEYQLTTRFLQESGGRPCLILTDLDPPYVHALTTPEHVVAPLNNRHSYRFNPAVFRFGDAERKELVEQTLKAGQQVWFIAMWSPDGLDESLLLTVPGYSWRIVFGSQDDGYIGRLGPVGSFAGVDSRAASRTHRP